MTVKVNEYGKRVKTIAYPPTFGVVCSQVFTFTIPSGTVVAATDVFEIAGLPERCRVVGGDYKADLIDATQDATTTLKVGLISGEFGDDIDDTRAIGTSLLLNGVSAVAAGVGVIPAGSFVIEADQDAKGIGLQFDTGFTAASDVTFMLQVQYTAS